MELNGTSRSRGEGTRSALARGQNGMTGASWRHTQQRRVLV